jgi:hypothetical protein
MVTVSGAIRGSRLYVFGENCAEKRIVRSLSGGAFASIVVFYQTTFDEQEE